MLSRAEREGNVTRLAASASLRPALRHALKADIWGAMPRVATALPTSHNTSSIIRGPLGCRRPTGAVPTALPEQWVRRRQIGSQ